jgi:hypothetical protein
MFLVPVLHGFDLKVEARERGETAVFPRIDDSISSGGVMGPRKGDDLIVQVSLRKDSMH